MVLSAEIVYPIIPSWETLAILKKSGYRLIVLSPSDDIKSNEAVVYRQWVRAVLGVLGDFFAIVRVPINFFQARILSDKLISDWLSGDEDLRLRVFGVHLMQGTLSAADYLMRIYTLLRSGFTYFLVVDDMQHHGGTFKNTVYDAACCVWTSKTKEHVARMTRVNNLLSLVKLWFYPVSIAVLPYQCVLRSVRWAKLWSKFENSKSMYRKSTRVLNTDSFPDIPMYS